VPTLGLQSVSPDGRWLAVTMPEPPGGGTSEPTAIFPIAGGSSPIVFSTNYARLKWHRSGTMLFVNTGRPTERGASAIAGSTVAFRLKPGQMWPDIPAAGFQSLEEISKFAGAQQIDSPDGAPGSTPETYAFSRETIQRNLYRIPIP
jgi:hypothetical protein